MKWLTLALAVCLLCSAPAAADAVAGWNEFRESGDIAWLEAKDWTPFAENLAMDAGHVSEAKYYVVWKSGGEIGVMLKYIYDPVVSPSSLPGPGPLKTEDVEVSINCSASVVRVHRMYLYAPDDRTIGYWFDPAAEANPQSFDNGSIIGRAASKVC